MKYNILVKTKSHGSYFLMNKPFAKHNPKLAYSVLDLNTTLLYFVWGLIYIKYEI